MRSAKAVMLLFLLQALSGCTEEGGGASVERANAPAAADELEGPRPQNSSEANASIASGGTAAEQPLGASNVSDETLPSWSWTDEYPGTFSEVEVGAAGFPVAQGNGRNCAVLRTTEGVVNITGSVVAEWDALTPAAERLQLVVMLDRDVAVLVEGSSPLGLELPGATSNVSDVSVFIGAPPGVSVVVAQEVTLRIDARYVAKVEGEIVRGNCVLGGG